MKNINKALLKQGKNVPWLAEKLGISHQAVYSWIQGKTLPSPTKLVALCKLLKLNLSDMVDKHYC